VNRDLPDLPESYQTLLRELKGRIQQARLRAAVAVNHELVVLYWNLGNEIRARQRQEGWGTRIIDRLAEDLHRAFPEMQGLSPRNLKYMRAFAEAWPDEPIVQATLAQLPWYHHIALLEKLKSSEQRLWYAQQTIKHGWSRNVLVHQIETGAFQRQGKALTNFDRTLPAPQSELAQQLLKDPYDFDFLALGPELRERDLEQGLIEHIQRFFVELGKGFAFVGNQYHLEIGGQDYYVDLLFYHLRLRCFVVIDLKVEDFRPEFAGKMNFYLSAVDDLLKHADDAPSIGMILCKDKNAVTVEYALRDSQKPMGVAQYRLTTTPPETLRRELPSPEDVAKEFPAFSLLSMRMRIERALYRRVEMLGLSGSDRMGIRQLLQQLEAHQAAPAGVEMLLPVLHTMNLAAHGRDRDLDSTTIDEALRTGARFLADLESGE
jgi:predicted nuclease of restriction endonuclease-like (RecB) superfamily